MASSFWDRAQTQGLTDRDTRRRRTSNEAIASSDVKDRFEQLNIETRANTPDEFRAFVADQMARWGKIVKDANIKLG